MVDILVQNIRVEVLSGKCRALERAVEAIFKKVISKIRRPDNYKLSGLLNIGWFF